MREPSTFIQRIGLPHHGSVIGALEQQGHCYRQCHAHHSALKCYEKAIFHCHEASFLQRHSLWVQIYTSYTYEYYSMQQYYRALEEYEHALEHIPDELLELSRIHTTMDLCRKKCIEEDVRSE